MFYSSSDMFHSCKIMNRKNSKIIKNDTINIKKKTLKQHLSILVIMLNRRISCDVKTIHFGERSKKVCLALRSQAHLLYI